MQPPECQLCFCASCACRYVGLLAQHYKYYIIAVVFAIPALTIIGLLLTVLMTRLVFRLAGSKKVFKRSSIPGNDVRMLWMGACCCSASVL